MIPVWDLFIRIFHWSLVGLIVSNQFFNESGEIWHERIGYAACVLVLLRFIWGFVGTKYARFKDIKEYWPKRGEFKNHVIEYVRGKSPRTLNHPPLAVIGMILMFGCILSLGLTGWMMGLDRFFGVEWVEEAHEILGDALLVLSIIHVLGVIRESFIHRENLIASMIHGKKREDS